MRFLRESITPKGKVKLSKRSSKESSMACSCEVEKLRFSLNQTEILTTQRRSTSHYQGPPTLEYEPQAKLDQPRILCAGDHVCGARCSGRKNGCYRIVEVGVSEGVENVCPEVKLLGPFLEES